MKKTLLALAIAGVMSGTVWADCGDAVTCNLSNQNMGDTSSSADNSQSQATQSNPSSNSNTSSGAINVDPSIQQSGNTVDQNGEQWSHSSSNASGNRSDNQSNSSSNSGGNTLGNQSDNANQLTGGNQSFTGSTGDSSASATTGNNRNELNNGQGQDQNQRADATSDQQQSAESNVDIDASDRSTTSYSSKVDARSLYIPAVAQPVIPSTNPAAGVTTIVGSCGPMFSINRHAVHGAFVGLTRTKLLEVGHEDFKAPYLDANGVQIKYEAYQQPDGGWQIMGHQAIYTIAVVNVSGSRQLGLGGGGGSAMNWAQGQAGGSSAMQRMVTNIHIEPCVAGGITPPPAVRTVTKIKE